MSLQLLSSGRAGDLYVAATGIFPFMSSVSDLLPSALRDLSRSDEMLTRVVPISGKPWKSSVVILHTCINISAILACARKDAAISGRPSGSEPMRPHEWSRFVRSLKHRDSSSSEEL